MATLHKFSNGRYFAWSCGRQFWIEKNPSSWDWLVFSKGQQVMTHKRWDSVKQVMANLPEPTWYDKMVYVLNEIYEFGVEFYELEERYGLTQDMVNGEFVYNPEWEAHPAEDMYRALKGQWEYLFFSAREGDKELEATAETDWNKAQEPLLG